MRKALLLFAACAVVVSAHAQRKGLWIAPQFTIGAGTMTDVYPTFFNTDVSAIFTVGTDAYYMFNDHIGAGSGISYGGRGFQWSYSEDLDRLEMIGTQAMIDVPLFFRAVTGKGGGGFFVNVGFTNHFTIAAEEKVKVNGEEVRRYTGSDAKSDFSTWSFSPFVYFGGNIRCGNRVQLTIGPEIAYQAPNNFSSYSEAEGHYLTFALKFGVGIQAFKPNK